MEKNKLWIKIKIAGFASLFFPIFLVLIGKILISEGFSHLVPNYEEGKYRVIQEILYFLGLGIFFFCNGVSDFISKRILRREKMDEIKKLNAYFLYTVFMLEFLNLISICGFIGFLICGNFPWLVVFAIINFLTQFSYFPTQKRFSKFISK